MGLSERKQKQKIGLDPRNLAWRHDTTSFGAQMLLKAGHTPGTSLGLSDNGLVNPIAAARKIDSSGIGMGRARREGGVEGGGVGSAGGNLDDLLRRLQAAEAGGDSGASSEGDGPKGKTLSGFARSVIGSGNVDTVVVTEQTSSPGASSSTTTTVLGRPSRMAHRNKFRTAKQLASQQNATAMSEILGIRSAASTPRDSPTPGGGSGSETEGSSSTNTFGDDLIVKNKTASTVQDYFKLKMEAKKAAMLASIAAASGGVSPADSLDTAVVEFEEPVVVETLPSAATSPAPAAEAEAEASGSSSSDSDEEAEPASVVAAVEEKRSKKGKNKALDEAVDETPAAGLSAKAAAKAEKKRLKAEAKEEAKRLKKEAKRAAKKAAKSGEAVTPPEGTESSKRSKKRSADDGDDNDAAAEEKAERKSVKKAKRKAEA